MLENELLCKLPNSLFSWIGFSKLRKSKDEVIIDVFEGKTIRINYNRKTKIAKVLNADVEWLSLYWFAWYAFHPDTEVYTTKKN